MQTQCVRAGIVAIAVLSMGLGLCGRVARAADEEDKTAEMMAAVARLMRRG